MSVMLPESHAQPYTSKLKKVDNQLLGSIVQPGVQNTNPPEERSDPHTIEDPTINQNANLKADEGRKDDLNSRVRNYVSPNNKYLTGTQSTEDHRPGYDEYGEELGKDARVWKTYVQEAARWDADLVDGWNRSLDLILSCIVLGHFHSVFVIESSKSLQPDPAGNSDQSLFTISQTLVLIANSHSGSPLNLTLLERPDFVVPASAVCVNTLWFLSLSLSVSVSLIAMLAKDWARGYIAELTGQPYQQARKRQRRWDGLKEWKVPEVIAFLPSLLHLALCIHLGAALPVLLVTMMSLTAYGVSTTLPLIHEHCPYSTPLSKLVLMLPKPTFPRRFARWMRNIPLNDFTTRLESVVEQQTDEDLMDETTSRALAWLIVNYEDSRSADIALQAIAGASYKLPYAPLGNCKAGSLIEQKLRNCFSTRITAQKLYLKDITLLEAASLYARALSAPVMDPIFRYQVDRPAVDLSVCLIDNNTLSAATSPNKLAFALSVIALNGIRNGLEPRAHIVLTAQLLELHLKDRVTLKNPALLELLQGAARWPSFRYGDESSDTECIRLMVTIAQFLPTLSHDGGSQIHRSVGAAFTAFACTHRNYSRWPLVENLTAHEKITSDLVYHIPKHYERFPLVDSAITSSLVIFGLLELLKHHVASLDTSDVTIITNALRHYKPRPASIDIFGLPKQAFGSDYKYITETALPFLTADSQGTYTCSGDVRSAWLAVFNLQYLEVSPYAMDICALALENLRSVRSGLLKQCCCNLAAQGPATWDKALSVGPKRQNIISLYLDMLEYEDERVVPYIMVGLIRIIKRQIKEPNHTVANREIILQPLLSYEQSLNTTQRSDQSSHAVTIDTFIACAEAWTPRLEDMVNRIPRHIWASSILRKLTWLLRSGTLGEGHPLYQRLQAFVNRIIKIPKLLDSPDWS
ncbi:hypothetical protein FRC12_023873 [Ceratobasidium sp. 428]|nr:hypothetical protein FRC12_023873 [Ceratobasidium sp. 428]